jgi:hypothetical protein
MWHYNWKKILERVNKIYRQGRIHLGILRVYCIVFTVNSRLQVFENIGISYHPIRSVLVIAGTNWQQTPTGELSAAERLISVQASNATLR